MSRLDVRLLSIAGGILALLSLVGWGERHTIAYRLQLHRARLVVSSIPRAKLVPWLEESLRADPLAAQRAKAASFLRHFRDEAGAVRALLQALGDSDPAVEAAAWDALNRPRCAFQYDCVSDATRSIPTEEFLVALGSTRVELARRDILEYVYSMRGERVDEALRIVIASGPSVGSGGLALYMLGWAGEFTGLVRDPAESPARARSIAREGVTNPDPWMRHECLMFLVALGGDGLGDEDGAWVAGALDTPGCIQKGLTALGTACVVHARFGEPPPVEDSGRGRVVALIDAIQGRFGMDRAVPFARAGAESDSLDVSVTCRGWLRDHGQEEGDGGQE